MGLWTRGRRSRMKQALTRGESVCAEVEPILPVTYSQCRSDTSLARTNVWLSFLPRPDLYGGWNLDEWPATSSLPEEPVEVKQGEAHEVACVGPPSLCCTLLAVAAAAAAVTGWRCTAPSYGRGIVRERDRQPVSTQNPLHALQHPLAQPCRVMMSCQTHRQSWACALTWRHSARALLSSMPSQPHFHSATELLRYETEV